MEIESVIITFMNDNCPAIDYKIHTTEVDAYKHQSMLCVSYS